MSKLVIAEKPMLARDIARAITGKEVSESARLPISGNGYTVCACAGHLLELVEPDAIDPKWGMPWSLDVLPIEVHDWPKEPAVDKKTGESKKPLIDQIAGLLKTCDSVIAAGDPDDEGQLIVDELLDYLGYAGKVERVYVNDNIEKNIVKAFDKLVPNDSCRGAGNAAYARQMADMCFGVNETRLATKRLDGLFTVGRVQTPTLGLVVKRDEAIARHVTRKFYETNASKWDEYCRDNNAVSYTFSSKEQMLASGILEKGDIIYMEPADWNHSNSDCHIGFFWGSNSSEDLFWHSSSHADGIVKGYFPNSAGGNVISKITPKYPVRYYRVIKTLHKGYLTLHKDSSNKTLTDANDCYSLEGAEYGVYTDSNCSNKVATLTTNASGNANTVSLNPGRYYVKETKAPKGYFTDSQVYTADVSGANRESSPVKLSVSDNPANDPMSMLLGKFDGQKTYNGAGNLPQGSATLAGAEFTVDYYATLDYKSYDDLKNADVKPMRSWTFSTDSNGFCSFDIAHFVSGDAFWYRLDGTPALPRGTVVIRETICHILFLLSFQTLNYKLSL